MEINKNYEDIRITDCLTLKAQVLYAFTRLKDGLDRRVKPKEIVKFLIETERLNVSIQAVNSILGKNKKLFNCNTDGFKIMKSGLEELENLKKTSNVIYIKPGSPYSTRHIELKQILGSISKFALIVDPYFDLNTVDFIYKNFPKDIEIKFITSQIKRSSFNAVENAVEDLIKEGFHIIVKLYGKSELHDRFIIDEKNIWVSGNSLNSLGSKESFLINAGEDIRLAMKEVFNRRWKVASDM